MSQGFITAFMLGLIGGVTPGPVLAAAFTEILQTGLRKSFRVILWAMFLETVVALTSLAVLSTLGLPAFFFDLLSLIGSGILIWIATQLWRIRKLDTGVLVHYDLGKLSGMILANGILWTYWITVCIPQAMALGARIHSGEYLFLALVQIGWLLATVGLALVFSRFRSLLSNPRVLPWVFRCFALIFLYFALNLAYTGAMSIAARQEFGGRHGDLSGIRPHAGDAYALYQGPRLHGIGFVVG